MKKILITILLMIVVHLKNGAIIEFRKADRWLLGMNKHYRTVQVIDKKWNIFAEFNFNEVLYVEKK